ncbi:unnamed protein product [Gordionus sp. m RMFG-2023]
MFCSYPGYVQAHFYGKFRESSSGISNKYPFNYDKGFLGDLDYKDECSKRCKISEDCCRGFTCMSSVIRNAFTEGLGLCVQEKKDKEGIACIRDTDCYPYECIEMKTIFPTLRFCQKPEIVINNQIDPFRSSNIMKKQFNDNCQTSQDCNQEQGLCCSRVRIHRQPHSLKCMYKESVKCVEGEDNETDGVISEVGSYGVKGERKANAMSRFFPMRLRPYFR